MLAHTVDKGKVEWDKALDEDLTDMYKQQNEKQIAEMEKKAKPLVNLLAAQMANENSQKSKAVPKKAQMKTQTVLVAHGKPLVDRR
jgi:hypothetical protein